MEQRRTRVGALVSLCALALSGCSETFSAADEPDAGGTGSGLVINEVDYDNPDLDLFEFVELFNGTGHDVSLNGLVLVLVNGAPVENAEYARVMLSGTLASGQYALIAAPGVSPNPSTLWFDFPGAENQIQNAGDAPDAVGLFSPSRGELIDALSYDGSVLGAKIGNAGTFDFVEGTPSELVDDGEGSLSRKPNGADTNDASKDWAKSSAPSPGAANAL